MAAIDDLVAALEADKMQQEADLSDMSVFNKKPDPIRYLKGKALKLQLKRPGLKQLLGEENPMLAGTGDPELDKIIRLRRS